MASRVGNLRSMLYWSTKPLPPWVSRPRAEDLPLGGVVDGAIDEPVAVADGLGREQDALCVQPSMT
jgi:hypothetical protein